MSLELSLFTGLLFHLVGDYMTQSHWMAVNKIKSFLPAFAHATIYSLPFLFICTSYWWLLLYITHFFIDRYRLAIYWVRLKNTTWNNGFIVPTAENCGFDKNTPAWLSTWLMILIDNIIHIIINSLSIYFAYSCR